MSINVSRLGADNLELGKINKQLQSSNLGKDDSVFKTAGVNTYSANNTEVEENALQEYQAAAEAAGKTEADEKAKAPEDTKAPEETKPTEETKATPAKESDEMKEIKEKIEKLEEEKKENLEKMDKIEDKIEQKAKDAEENIAAAAAAKEQQVEEHKEESQQVLHENIQAYIAANKEGGEGMTRDELNENIKNALPEAPAAGDALAALTAASADVNEMDTYLGKLDELIQDTHSIDQEIKGLNEQYDAAAEAQAAAEAAEAQKQCCDPIGFTVGEGENKTQYDFIVDDGAFDSTSDFLGAKDQWAEMEALDTDKDGKVTSEEMAAGNIKAVKKGADGKQEVVDISKEFGDDFSVDLNSYKQGGTHEAIDTTTGQQEMLGTFDVNIAGEAVSAYNTMDSVDFLEQSYGITSETEDAEKEATEYSQELQPHVNFFEEYTQKSVELKEEISKAYGELGLTEEEINGINDATKKEADEKAEVFLKSIGASEKAEEEEKAEDVPNEEETEPADEAPVEEPAATTDEEAGEEGVAANPEGTTGPESVPVEETEIEAADKETETKEETPTAEDDGIAYSASADTGNPFAKLADIQTDDDKKDRNFFRVRAA